VLLLSLVHFVVQTIFVFVGGERVLVQLCLHQSLSDHFDLHRVNFLICVPLRQQVLQVHYGQSRHLALSYLLEHVFLLVKRNLIECVVLDLFLPFLFSACF